MSDSYHLLFCIPLAFGILAWLVNRRRLPLPPGPKGWPILGHLNNNFHRNSERHTWLHYADWAALYGDVIHVKTLGQSTVILNSAEAATELLEKRSSNYSDRPIMVMADELMKWDWNLIHMPYSNEWRIHRRTLHQYFQVQKVGSFQSIQLQSTANMLQAFLQSSEGFANHVRHNTVSIILKIVYGYETKASHNEYVELAKEAMRGLSQAAIVGSYLVDIIPILKYVPSWFPGTEFKRQAEEWSKTSLALKNRPFDAVKASIADGTAVPSFVTKNLETNISSEMEEIIRNCAGVAYLGGAETITSVVLFFMQAMVLYPDVQARAQAEIDSIIGASRLPEFQDRSDLPYVEAVLNETLRWRPVAPLSFPHRSIHADEYNGYYIPPGSTVIANAWAILHDPNTYPDPSTFKPERFLNQDAPLPDPANYAFGFGRRVCPGRHLALNSAWIAIVSILHSFSITKARDANGSEIEPVADCTDGIIVSPVPFKCSIKPRSPEIVNLIEHACNTSSS